MCCDYTFLSMLILCTKIVWNKWTMNAVFFFPLSTGEEIFSSTFWRCILSRWLFIPFCFVLFVCCWACIFSFYLNHRNSVPAMPLLNCYCYGLRLKYCSLSSLFRDNREFKIWRRQSQRQRHKSMIWLVEWRKIIVRHVWHAFWWNVLT